MINQSLIVKQAFIGKKNKSRQQYSTSIIIQ
jgi:hypothetical protein